MNKLHLYKQTEELNERIITLYDSISEHLESTLNFIEDFFGNYFDRNEKVPVSYLNISIQELCRQLEKLKKIIEANETLDSTLSDILINNFSEFCKDVSKGVTYNELMYQKDLMNELLTDKTLDSDLSIKEVLFYFNFNNDDYVAYVYQKLSTSIEILELKSGKNCCITV